MNLNDHTDDPIELRADPVTREIIDVADGIDRVHIACRPLMDDSALLERLVALLSNSDGAAVDMLEQSWPSLKVILGETTLLQVSEAVRQFKFTEALDAIAETADGSGI